ncbi:hypothetical protein Ahy_B03g068385 [Arachis hypogaea]|uniref:Mitochondrial import inner membrane translocase subunit n=1 Tax=Arachis hypogaea TaxID=3818 RepID=A0A445A9J0_ARAHY|nr:hypothetical protein Ahy_B03g068385 [Arachis hypogaea]
MDKNMLAGLESLPEADQQRMASMMEQVQIRDRAAQIVSDLCGARCSEAIAKFSFKPVLRMYNSLVEKCFTDCVDTFKHKSLQKQEETCVKRCAEKFLKHSMRVGMRYAELNQGAPTQD